jgi:hypothetical protein
MKCEECKGSGKYVGLYEVGECRTCGGGTKQQPTSEAPDHLRDGPEAGAYRVKIKGIYTEVRHVSMGGMVWHPMAPAIQFRWDANAVDGQPLYDWATAVKIAEPS